MISVRRICRCHDVGIRVLVVSHGMVPVVSAKVVKGLFLAVRKMSCGISIMIMLSIKGIVGPMTMRIIWVILRSDVRRTVLLFSIVAMLMFGVRCVLLLLDIEAVIAVVALVWQGTIFGLCILALLNASCYPLLPDPSLFCESSLLCTKLLCHLALQLGLLVASSYFHHGRMLGACNLSDTGIIEQQTNEYLRILFLSLAVMRC